MKKQGLHIVKLESLNCLMTFDFVPILVIMSPCVYVPLARLEQYILEKKTNVINRVSFAY